MDVMDQTVSLKISAVLFQEATGAWSAQCLEYDIAAQAVSLPELRYELERVLVSHLAVAGELGQEPFFGLKPAPQKYWEMFERAADCRIEGEALPFRLPKLAPHVIPKMRVADVRELEHA